MQTVNDERVILSRLAEVDALRETFSVSQLQALLIELWFPLLHSIRHVLETNSRCIFGVTGPPGVGKSSVAAALSVLIQHYTKQKAISIALEDFYYSPATRARRNVTWRAAPGSHNLRRLKRLLKAVRNDEKIDSVPQYDMKNDRPKPALAVGQNITHLVLEGWIIHSKISGYEFISDYLDSLIYLDASTDSCKRWRLERERNYRSTDPSAGYAEETMNKFWLEVLEPGINLWVRPQKNYANIIVNFDPDHRVQRISDNGSSIPKRVPV